MVIDKKYLMDNFFNNGIDEIVFQHRNKKGADPNRQKFHLIAYAEHQNGSFSHIDENVFFADRTAAPLFINMQINNDGVTTDFANLYLKKSDFADDPKYKYIILWPEVFNPAETHIDKDRIKNEMELSNKNADYTNPMDSEYIHYKMYFAENVNDAITDTKKVQQINALLNPSPPRNR